MADNNKNEQDKTKPQVPAAAAQPEPVAGAPRNLTRESIEQTMEGQYIAAGKAPEEAKSLAKKRALEMIPADAT